MAGINNNFEDYTFKYNVLDLNRIKKPPIYIIAHTWKDIELEIEVFYSKAKVLKAMSNLMEWDKKPHPDDDPSEYISDYHSWVREEKEDCSDLEIVLKIIYSN